MSSQAKAHALFDLKIVRRAIVDSFLKLDPRKELRNPVMFTVYVGSILTTALWVQSFWGGAEESPGFILAVAAWLWFLAMRWYFRRIGILPKAESSHTVR